MLNTEPDRCPRQTSEMGPETIQIGILGSTTSSKKNQATEALSWLTTTAADNTSLEDEISEMTIIAVDTNN